jgi:hypothetical protein
MKEKFYTVTLSGKVVYDSNGARKLDWKSLLTNPFWLIEMRVPLCPSLEDVKRFVEMIAPHLGLTSGTYAFTVLGGGAFETAILCTLGSNQYGKYMKTTFIKHK